MLSELVFSFMLKFEVKKKKESELVGFFGGVFPARTGICVSAWNCSLRFIYSLTLKSCDNAYWAILLRTAKLCKKYCSKKEAT